ncbi:MAG: GNAT family N-acetyltransferase [Clostridia bacterium]|nr:GNAT family N-acetyltransferase [Clostridia bacterium]
MKLEFRKAAIEDLPPVLDIYREGVRNMISNGINQWDDEYPNEKVISEDIRKGELNLCICNGEIAAAYALNTHADPDYDNAKWQNPDANWCAMHRLCVSPRFHRRGIATACMLNIEQDALSQGFEAVHLDTFSGNSRAMELYNKLGYKQVGEMFWTRGRFVIFEKILIVSRKA